MIKKEVMEEANGVMVEALEAVVKKAESVIGVKCFGLVLIMPLDNKEDPFAYLMSLNFRQRMELFQQLEGYMNAINNSSPEIEEHGTRH